MKVINWLGLQLCEREIHALQESISGGIAVRKLSQHLVNSILEKYPWNDRTDLISLYHPRNSYNQGDWIALPKPDEQSIRPTYWQIARISDVERTENELQGKFDVIILDLDDKQQLLAANIPSSSYYEPNFSKWTPEDIVWLADHFADAYAKSIQNTIEKLISSNKLPGSIVDKNFLPNNIKAIPQDILTPFFGSLTDKNPWISIEKILRELSLQKGVDNHYTETLRSMVNLALEKSYYISLGGNRWTTQEIFDELNRDIPRGVPAPHVRSKINIWTKADELDFSKLKKEFTEGPQIEECEITEELPDIRAFTIWHAPKNAIRLPTTLSYLHITQAYFPISHILGAFPPDCKLLFVQIIEGDHQPFLIDRDLGVLKALEVEKLRTSFLELSIPAGTYLWLEYQDGDHYRIRPNFLQKPHDVSCKLAYLENGVLHIELANIQMLYEGDPSVFKADLRFEDIDALFEEAQRNQLSVRDAIIQSVQELCSIDPNKRAYYRDIFNLVFLKRMCSYNSVLSLLYSHPCFERIEKGFFRLNPSNLKTKKIDKTLKPGKEPYYAPKHESTPIEKPITPIKKQSGLTSLPKIPSEDNTYPTKPKPKEPAQPPETEINTSIEEKLKKGSITKPEKKIQNKFPSKLQIKVKETKIITHKKYSLIQHLWNRVQDWWNALKRNIWRKKHG